MGRLQWTRYRDRLGLTEKGKEKHESTLKKQGTLNIVIYCVYDCMGCGLNFFERSTALNLNPWYNIIACFKTFSKACFHTLPKDKNLMDIFFFKELPI